MAKVLQFSRHVNTGEPLLSSSALESRGSIHPLSADRGNEGRRVANCTDSRRFSVSRRSLQHPLPRRLALLAGGSTPLSTTTATAALRHPLCCPLLAQAPPLLCTLYPILIHIRVSTATSTQGQREISRFTTSSCGFHGLRVYVAPGSTVRSFFFFSLFFSFLFFSYATRSVKRSRDPSATIRPLSFSSFIRSPHPFHSLVPSLARFFMHRMLAVPPWNSFSSPKKKLRRTPRDIILVVIFRAIARPAP